MSADIVERLEAEGAAKSWPAWAMTPKLIREAAAEIVRLRGEAALAAAFREVSKCSYAQDGVAGELFAEVYKKASIAPAEAKGEAPGKNVHTEHCCREHGCKYGDAECPVEHGRQVQTYPCEDCTHQPADGGAVAWLPPTEVPCVKYGSYGFFWVAVRRAHNGKIYSFPAAYLNEMGLTNDDDEPVISVSRGNHWIELPPVDDEFTMLATGWYSAKEQHGDDLYQPLLDSTDELVAWRPVADYPLGDVLYTHPPAAQAQGEGAAERLYLAHIQAHPRAGRVPPWRELAEWERAPWIKAAHPSACELGAVRERPEGRDHCPYCFSWFGGPLICCNNGYLNPENRAPLTKTEAATARTALQHRGDSRGGESS